MSADERLAERLGDGGGVTVETDGGVLLVDEHLDAGRHRDAAADRPDGRRAFHRGEPAQDRAPHAAAARCRGPAAAAVGPGAAGPGPRAVATRRSITSPVSPANSRVSASSVAPSICRSLMASTWSRWR